MNVDNYQSSQAVGYTDFRNMSDLFTSEHRFRKLCNTEYFFTVLGAASKIFSQFYLFQHHCWRFIFSVLFVSASLLEIGILSSICFSINVGY